MIVSTRLLPVVLLSWSSLRLPIIMGACSDHITIGSPGWQQQVMEEVELHGKLHLCLPASMTSKNDSTIPTPTLCGEYQIPHSVMTTVDRIASDLLIGPTKPTESVITRRSGLQTETRFHTTLTATLCGSRPWSHSLDQVDFVVTMDRNTLPATNRPFILMSLEEPYTSLWIVGPRQVIFHQNERNDDKALYLARTYQSTIHNPSNVVLCKDMGMKMVMYMRGFHWSTAKRNELLPCLHFYVSQWGLVNLASFKGAMVFSFLLAFLTQGLSAIRAIVVKHVTNKQRKKPLLLLIYVLQSFMGYLIMLIAMMYSWELLLSVVLGVMMGNRLFTKSDKREVEQSRRRQSRKIDSQETLLCPTTTASTNTTV